MRRRELIAIAGTGLVAWPLVAGAQQQARTARLGYLGFGSPTNAVAVDRVEALRAGLRDLGYVEGKNLVTEFRWSDTVEQLHEAAAELVRLKVDMHREGFHLQLTQYDDQGWRATFDMTGMERDIDEPSSRDSLRLLIKILGCTFDDLLKG